MSDTFKIEELALPGVFLIKPKVHSDSRGLSAVPYAIDDFAAIGITSNFVQDYTSRSIQGTIRGIHYQKSPHAQDKLVRCSWGKIFDVVADFDPNSPAFGTYVSTVLSGDEQSMLFVPGKYAHGFCVVADEAITEYKMSDVYALEYASGIRWDDPILHIDWPVSTPIVSEQDMAWSFLPLR